MVKTSQFIKKTFIFLNQHRKVLVSFLVFLLGFMIDVLTIRRIDSPFNLFQHGFYLLILGIFLVFEMRKQNLWKYHDLVVHFLFGSLLSLSTIFYYTSASLFSGLLFLLLLLGLMLANEIHQIRAYGLPVRVILFSVCSLLYFCFLYPIILGKIGVLPFWLGILTSVFILLLLWFLNFKRKFKLDTKLLFLSLGVHALFVMAYYTALIPPVPMAIKKMGVYYGVEKRDDQYIGQYLNQDSYFFTKEFKTRPDDRIFILVSIFSPTHFRDQIHLKWYRYDDQKGKILEDNIPLNILGGRDEGFRGYASKQYYAEGKWEVFVETSDGRELGRLRFQVVKDSSLIEREFHEDIF